MTARIVDVTPDAYHKLPGFSASLAKVCIGKSPMHAKDAYDRGVEDDIAEEDEPTEATHQKFETGDILHTLLLGKGKRFAVLPYDAWTTKAARAARDEARASGLIPIKERQMEMYERMAAAMRSRIEDAGHTLDGQSEVAITWTEQTSSGSVDCRCMIDHLVTWGLDGSSIPGAIIYELKPVADAHPERCERTAESLGYGIAAAAYVRALTALYPQLGGRIEFRFLWAEYKRPYALWDPVRDGVFAELGEQRWVRALNKWARGLTTGVWPAYREDRREICAPVWAAKNEGYTQEEV